MKREYADWGTDALLEIIGAWARRHHSVAERHTGTTYFLFKVKIFFPWTLRTDKGEEVARTVFPALRGVWDHGYRPLCGGILPRDGDEPVVALYQPTSQIRRRIPQLGRCRHIRAGT